MLSFDDFLFQSYGSWHSQDMIFFFISIDYDVQEMCSLIKDYVDFILL